MNNLIHTHTEDPLSKAICSGCIISRHMAEMAELSAKSRLGNMTKKERSAYFSKVRKGEKVSKKKLPLDK